MTVLQQLKVQPDSRFVEELQNQLQHSSHLIQEQTIRNLYLIQNIDLSKKITPLLLSDSLEVRIAAFSYLVSRAGRHAPIFVKRYLEVKDHLTTLPLLVALAEESRDNPYLKQRFRLADHLTAEFNALADRSPGEKKVYSLYLLRAAGFAKIPQLYPRIERHLTDPDLEIRKQAIKAAGITMDPYFIAPLIELLGEKESSAAAVNALVNFGNEIIPAIIKYLKPARVTDDIVKNLPQVVESFPVQISVDFLFLLAEDQSVDIRIRALRALVNLSVERPSLSFHSKRSLQNFRDEWRKLLDLSRSHYYLSKAMNTQDAKLKGAMDETLQGLHKSSFSIAKYWLALSSGLVKDKSNPNRASLNKKKVDIETDAIRDSSEKSKLMALENSLQVDSGSDNLDSFDSTAVKDLESALQFLSSISDKGRELSDGIRKQLGANLIQ